jgi:mannose-6-phosphate isomerase-like protein (cupin superfamily)
MPARTFDYRDDPSGTIIVTPQVRAKFLKRMPGQELGGFHGHIETGGVETWVILEGAARFDFKDGSVVATAGQAVFAYTDEPHRVSCHGDQPVVYFLTVSPHIDPTHTPYDKDWNRLPSQSPHVNPTWQGKPALTLTNRG